MKIDVTLDPALEELLDRRTFVRVSHSEIVNWKPKKRE